MDKDNFKKKIQKIDKKISKGLTKKILKKPVVKGQSQISAKKTLKSFAHNSEPLVREVERVDPVRDDRSQFFNNEFKREERSVNKWLS